MRTLWKLLATAAWLAFGLLGSARAADWEVWTPPGFPPESDPFWAEGLLPPGKTSAFVPGEADTNWLWIDVHQTREKDGKLYKAVQLCRDTEVEDTVTVGTWLWGGFSAMLYPVGSGVDPWAMWTAWRLLSIELDGTVIPIDIDTYRIPDSWTNGDTGITYAGAVWAVLPRFNTAGTHTYKMTFRQVEEFFFVENFTAHGAVDPDPQYEGRRVYVGEVVGSVLDGDIVYTYTLNVVPPTAVEPCSWARIKAAVSD